MGFNHMGRTDIRGGTLSFCPFCKKRYNGFPAISRKDNKTKICPECGNKEALEAFEKYLKERK